MNKIRIITFALAIILAFSALASCDTVKPSETTKEQTTEEKSITTSESETTEKQTQAPDKPTDEDEEESTAAEKPITPEKPNNPNRPNRPNNPQPKPETEPDVVETTEVEYTETALEDEEDTFDENVLETGGTGNYQSDFILSNCDDVNPMRYYWADPNKNETDDVYEAVYARQQAVYDQLGVNVIVTHAGSFRDYVSNFKNAVKTNSDAVHTLLTHVNTGIPSLISEGYLQDIGSMPGIDLNQDYWNREFMEELSFEGANKNYYFLGFSDFNILYTHVVAFNKQMMSQVTEGVYDKSVYQMVTDYEWTLDRMLNVAQLVSVDLTGDGKTTDDTYGLTGQQWVPWVGLMHASGINYVERDPSSGERRLSMMNDTYKQKTYQIVTKLKEFSASKYGYFVFQTSNPVDVQLTSGRALMQLSSTYNLTGFFDSDITFGVLPYPMYSSHQREYRSLQWGGYLTVPSTLTTRTRAMTGDTLEALAFHSGNVHKVFYEKLLGRHISDMPDDAKMLDYVWDGVCADFGQTYTDICSGTLYVFPSVTWPGEGGKELSSTVSGSFEKTVNRSIRKFINYVFDLLEDKYSPKPFPAPTPVPPDEYPPEEDTTETEETWGTEETTEPIESDEVLGTEAPWY